MLPSEDIDDYAKGWSELMKLVRNGYSWSGSERNRFFLNNRKGAFHEMSHLAGLDHRDDGRALAIIDWDQDGRLDLCYRNRTAPRLRLMLNRKKSPPSAAIRLEGTSSNRDAIGALVELLPAPSSGRLVRSVKAGDLFLSQSSKWLHFGLGDNGGEFSAKVLWPGGQSEIFRGIKPGRFRLKQGTGKTLAIAQRDQIDLESHELVPRASGSGARIILPARVKLPLLAYRDQAAKRRNTTPAPSPKLLLLWSGSCPDCAGNLSQLASQSEAIRKNGLKILALSIDGIGGPGADLSGSYDLIDRTKFPFPWGLIDQKSTGTIHRFQETLFDRTPPPSVPLALLLDENHRVLAIYRGKLSVTEVLEDLWTIRNANPVQLYHFAPPMSGTWFTNPLAPRNVDRLFKVPKAADSR